MATMELSVFDAGFWTEAARLGVGAVGDTKADVRREMIAKTMGVMAWERFEGAVAEMVRGGDTKRLAFAVRMARMGRMEGKDGTTERAGVVDRWNDELMAFWCGCGDERSEGVLVYGVVCSLIS